MAKVNLYQAKAISESVTYEAMEASVNYLWSRIVSTPKTYPTFMFKYGMPGPFAGGKYGYEITGLAGMHALPEPKPGDHRVTMRYFELPNYRQKYGNFFRFVIPITHYWKKDKLTMEAKDARHKFAIMLKAASEVYPLYLKYLSWSMLKGKNRQLAELDQALQGWVTNVIEPSDYSTNGSVFYNKDGYGEINLGAVIKPNNDKAKQHPLKEALKKINDELVKDSKKSEYDFNSDTVLKDKKFIKDNIVDQKDKKLIGLCYHIAETIEKILDAGNFIDKKYKVKNDATTWEDVCPPISGVSDLVLVMPRQSVRRLQKELDFMTNGTVGFALNSSFFHGVEMVISDALDDNTAYLINRDLIQCWFMPVLSDTLTQPYLDDETTDYKAKFGHSLDLIDIQTNIYFTCK